MTMLRRLFVTLAALAVAAAAVIWWTVPAAERPKAVPDDPRQVALGERIYAESCASCHGANLEGQPDWQIRGSDGRLPAPPHDDTGHTWHHPDWQLFEIIKFGVERFAWPGYESDMPAFTRVLEDEEIWAVLTFIKSHWGERERRFQERVTETSEEPEP
jgi:mono/diheme cytochrome c family protein